MFYSSLLLPAHGNAPYLLGIKLLLNLDVDICVPHYYGEVQNKILREEFPVDADADRIFLSKELGLLLKPLLRDRTFSLNFDTYAQNVNQNIESISVELEKACRQGINATSLNGRNKSFTAFDFALNTGLPILSPVKPVFYAFVGKMSEIYRLSPYQNSGIQELTENWKRIEFSLDHMFVPRLNSLYKLDYDATGITFTPPFTHPYPSDNLPIPSGAILVVASGTGLDLEKLLLLANSFPGKFFTLPESPKIVDLPRVPSSSWGNPNIVAVLARSGLGTIWQALLNQKPVGVVRVLPQEDPEIFHNADMVQRVGIGGIIDTDLDNFVDTLPRYLSMINKQLDEEMLEFGTIDGIEFTSYQLKQLLS